MKPFFVFVFTFFLQPTVDHLFMKKQLKANCHLLDKSCSRTFLQPSFITDFITKNFFLRIPASPSLSNLSKLASKNRS